jgi:hypothetical protein
LIGHPIGRKFTPKFPASFRLPTDNDQTANNAVRNDENETQTAKNETQTANSYSQTANLAVTYKETSSQTSPKTSPHTAQQAAQGVSFDEFWSSLPSPMKKGKALARKHWAKLDQVQRKAAKDGLVSYLKTDEPKRGFYKHGSTYLSARVWEDYEAEQGATVADPEKERETQIKAVALDKINGTQHHKRWFKSLEEGYSALKDRVDAFLAHYNAQMAAA